MSACEHCWSRSRLLGIEYHEQLVRAEIENDTCTQNTIEGKRLRAGQFWDEEKQLDRCDAAVESNPTKENSNG